MQYPRQQFVPSGVRDPQEYGRRIFKTQMPWPQRVAIGVTALVAAALLLAAAAVMLFGLYLFLTA